MKKLLGFCLLAMAASAQAQDLTLVCKIQLSDKTPTYSSYKLNAERTKVQHEGAGEAVPLTTTETMYAWRLGEKGPDGKPEFLHLIDRQSGTLQILVGTRPVASGTCEKAEPKF